MKAINFYQQYIDDNQLSIFHTGSLAEHHEPALRKLLSQYVQELDGTSEADAQKILDDDTAFSLAVQTYKHIVTHYLSGKMENWLGIFMGPIFGVIAALIVFEFAKTRGAIHYHSLLICDNENFQQKLQESLEILALSIHESVKKLNTFICNNWSEERDATNFEVRPDLLICAKNGENERMKFCNESNEGKQVWRQYWAEKETAISTANREIGKLMEHNYGVHAMHQGTFPNDWVRPGGHPFAFYPRTQTNMQSSKEVLDKRELKQHKHK